jgi:hypothetical protein
MRDHSKVLDEIATALSGSCYSDIDQRFSPVRTKAYYPTRAVVVYYNFDDQTIHFDGEVSEEISLKKVHVDVNGPFYNACSYHCPNYGDREKDWPTLEIDEDDDNHKWNIVTKIPHVKFQMIWKGEDSEDRPDGNTCGVGIVFSLDEVPMKFDDTWAEHALKMATSWDSKTLTEEGFKEALKNFLRNANIPRMDRR